MSTHAQFKSRVLCNEKTDAFKWKEKSAESAGHEGLCQGECDGMCRSWTPMDCRTSDCGATRRDACVKFEAGFFVKAGPTKELQPQGKERDTKKERSFGRAGLNRTCSWKRNLKEHTEDYFFEEYLKSVGRGLTQTKPNIVLSFEQFEMCVCVCVRAVRAWFTW